jgi:CheY-like chemotaxis protein
MLRRLIGEDIDLVWRPGYDIWQIEMDPVQIDQILTNLCLNARDAMTENGRITIETENVKFDETCCSTRNVFSPGDFVMLAVSDNGRGMSPDIIDNIFEPFFTTKELGQGTGLGLATTHGIVKQNNGFINVYSEPGRGTTFKVYLPRQYSKNAVPESPADVRDEKVTGGTILVVEDEKSLLELNTSYLESIGYRVLPAASPVEALKIAAANDIDLLLTDVVMPEMNGRVLFERIAAIKPGIKVLFMSGYTANVIIHQGILEKGCACIQKPFSLKSLGIRLSEILNR